MRGARSSSSVQLLVVVMAECPIHELAELAWSCRGLCAVPTGIPWAGGRASVGLLMEPRAGVRWLSAQRTCESPSASAAGVERDERRDEWSAMLAENGQLDGAREQ